MVEEDSGYVQTAQGETHPGKFRYKGTFIQSTHVEEKQDARFDPQQGYDFLMLLRGEPHNFLGIRKAPFTLEESERATQLIEDISARTEGINPESLRRLMFDSISGKPVPGEERTVFGGFDMVMILIIGRNHPKDL